MTRAMLVTVLYRQAGMPGVTGEYHIADVHDANAWYYDAVMWAWENQIVDGYMDGTFRPNEPLTREELVTILYRYAAGEPTEIDMSGYTDAKLISPWAQDAFKWALGSGIVEGTSDTTLSPHDGAKRCQVAAMLVRLLDL